MYIQLDYQYVSGAKCQLDTNCELLQIPSSAFTLATKSCIPSSRYVLLLGAITPSSAVFVATYHPRGQSTGVGA